MEPNNTSGSSAAAPSNPTPRPQTPRGPRPPFKPRTGANYNTRDSLKSGFAKEEGYKGRGTSDKNEVKRANRRRGPLSMIQPLPRMGAYKHNPQRKTGSDTDALHAEGTRLKVTVVGGNEEIGRNCTLLEYGDDIIIIDLGLQFPDDDMPGVDYIIPNLSSLKGREKNVRGVIITHGHYDHIGGVPHIVPTLGNPPVFATDLTCGIIAKRQEDHKDKPRLNLFSVTSDDVLQLGAFKVEFFGVAHSVPSSLGVIVNTPAGIIVHTGDFKLEEGPGAQSKQDTEKIKALGDRNVLALMCDSTNASKPGRQMPEIEIQNNIDEIIKNAKGRIIIGTFASMIARVQQIIKACERSGRKVAIEGFSMKSNVMIAQQLGYMDIGKSTLIDARDIDKYPREKTAVVCTGAQGEERAALMRIANHEHQNINLVAGDTVVFSSSIIPGNERSVQRVKDTLCREGAEVVHYKMMDVHAGGHAQQDDLVEMHAMIKPKYLIPIEGHYSFLVDHAKVAIANGFNPNNIFIADNGQVMEFDHKGNGMLTNKKIDTNYIFVDGLGVGNTNQIVLRDRQHLAGDGVVILVAVIDGRTGNLEAMPDIISRGFTYMKEQQELVAQSRAKAAAIVKTTSEKSTGPLDMTYLKDKLRDEMGEFLYVKTQLRPMVIPVLIEV
ncbi:MAG: ribonuclease J [Candidatus Magasanikbacteria bacterium]|nr:ribonuclease J [Candidatus Magasanikbacteria bacterium]